MTDTPKIRVIVAAPPSVVWDALRDRDRIRQWHGWEFEGGVDGSLDQEIEVIYFTDIAADQNGILLNGGDRIDIEPVAGGTSVTLTRAAPANDPDWDRYYDDITQGWVTFIQQLRFAVEHHPSDTRRTVLLRGRVARSPLTTLGTEGLHPDEEFALALPGETATGRVWFRSEHQLGLVIDEWNTGLLVLSHDPASGLGMALLSLYGVAEERHAELLAQWTRWWDDNIQ